MNKLTLNNMVLNKNNIVTDNSCYISSIKKRQTIKVIKNIAPNQKIIDFLNEFAGISIHTMINNYLSQHFDIILPKIISDLNKSLLIGRVYCCGQRLQVFYDFSQNVFVDENGNLIAIDDNKLFEYFLSPQSILPINILPETMQYLKESGWYIGRKKNVDYLLERCKKGNIELSELQIAFLEEYIDLEGKNISGKKYKIYVESEISYIDSSKIKINTMECFNPINRISTIEKISFLKVGEIGNLTVPIWISSDGRLFMDQGNQLGRTIMEGLQEIVLN